VLQFALVALAIALWRAAEIAIAGLGRTRLAGGGRGSRSGALLLAGAAWGCLGVLFALSTGGIASLAVWSATARWRWPDPWPAQLSLELWTRDFALLAGPTWTTVVLGLAAALLALALVVGCLENEQRRGRPAGHGGLLLIYLPLLVPQIGFLFGVQVLLVGAGLDGTWPALVWTHLLFVLPYVFLALADPWRALDRRYARSALSLGRTPLAVLWRIKLPLLLRPVLVALALGFAVSVAQFLPTLFAGGGRFATLTTEALALAAGGNRRIVGMFGLMLAVLPLLGFALAVAIPAWRARHRAGLRVEA
jgi:putative thiamine transport system permease protein